MKLKIAASVFFAVLLIASSGCIGGFDFERVAETSPQIQSFMAEHPNAEIKIIHLTEEQSAAMIDEIREQCGEQMAAKEYYKVTIDDEESGLMLIAYIDAETEQLEGAYIKGGAPTQTLVQTIYTLFTYGGEWHTITFYPNRSAITVDCGDPHEPYEFSWELSTQNAYYILENDKPILKIRLYHDNTCIQEDMESTMAVSGIWSYSPIPTPTPTPSPVAPQVSIRGTVVQSGGYNLVKLEHQGGDTLTVSASTLIIRVGGYTTTETDFTRTITSGVLGVLARYDGATTQQLSIGQCLYIWNDGTTNHFDITMGTPGADLPAAGSSVNIQIIDIASQQSIADLTVRG